MSTSNYQNRDVSTNIFNCKNTERNEIRAVGALSANESRVYGF